MTTAANGTKEREEKEKKIPNEAASISSTLQFVFRCGWSTQLLFAGGTLGGIGHGLAWPLLAYFMSKTLQTLSGVSSTAAMEDNTAILMVDPMDQIRDISFTFIALGVYSLVTAFFQTFCFEMAAARASRLLQHDWLRALLQKDMSYWDTLELGTGTTAGTSICLYATEYRKGMGAKLGEVIQNATTAIAGIVFGFYAAWNVALLILGILPLVCLATFRGIQLNRTKNIRAADCYRQAGSVASTTLSSLRTILSLNALPKRVEAYQKATMDALQSATSFLWQMGFWSGAMMGSIICLFALVVLFGSYVMYRDVEVTGCDPSGSLAQSACPTVGADIYAAMMGILFAGQALSRLGNCLEGFQQARVAVARAMQVIQQPEESNSDDIAGQKEELHYTITDDNQSGITEPISLAQAEEGKSQAVGKNKPHQTSTKDGKEYKYDPFSKTTGIPLNPETIQGAIEFQNITFAYPSRPSEPILKNFNLQIPAGKTVALVGPSGGGKSTVLGLIERYYSPLPLPGQGQILLDGTNIQHLNLKAYRQCIGYVAQEPVLFAASIRDNIAHGATTEVTQEQIETAAKMANAHDFITSFPEGYDTPVGLKGAQLSGGEKQRIAIARVLVSNPHLLLLDEATSALDSQSELVVQAALDRIVQEHEQARTTIIVAHRLSTIRNADLIVVIANGQVVEQGTHDDLVSLPQGHYRHLVETQEGGATTKADNDNLQKVNANSKVDLTKEESSPLKAVAENYDDGQSSEFLVSSEFMALPETAIPERKLSPAPNGFNEEGASSDTQDIPQIQFHNVTFSYPARPTKTIFQNFSLSIMQGETLALVGPSGGGKSTTIAMVQRFYDPDSGSVEYKGHDITELNIQWYRDQIGYVGQEPTLFPGTIAENIALGSLTTTSQGAIEEVAKQANAHDFIMSFPDGYETQVGELGTQISGGQKQRIAIARAMIKTPPVMILDEATSALDSGSEAIVQEALTRLMVSRKHTTIVIAHKLSTIRDADRIAFVKDGKVLEIGSHKELISKKHGYYRKLVAAQRRGSTMDNDESETDQAELKASKPSQLDEADETDKDTTAGSSVFSVPEGKEPDDVGFTVQRIKEMAAPNIRYIIVGSVGSLLQGATYPFLGLLFASTIDLFFYTVRQCPDPATTTLNNTLFEYDSCEDYWGDVADDMQSRSFQITLYYCLLMVQSFVGSAALFWGFGQASERLTKRVRDDTFSALVRQEVGYFDRHNIGVILSELEDSTARLHAFAGTPVRQMVEAATSVLAGIIVSFVFMWPFALMSITCLVPLGVAVRLNRKEYAGESEDGAGSKSDSDPTSPGSIVSETIANIKTVAALGLESKMFDAFNDAVLEADKGAVQDSLISGVKSGLGLCIQRFSNALLYFWGGYLLVTYPTTYAFRDFVIAQFTFILGMLGLGAALQDLDDRQEVQKCATRVFKILDRQSAIDSLSDEGKKLD